MGDPLPYFHRLSEDRYEASRATESPWSTTQQHGGPPLALAAYAMLRAHPSDERRPASVVLDFLGAVPLGEVTIATSVRRPGGRIDLLEARLEAAGRPFAEARMWRIRRDATLAVPDGAEDAPPGAVPPAQPQRYFTGVRDDWGYGTSIDWRFERGGLGTLGPASVWTRVHGELVSGEGIDPIARALVVADSANGVSAVLPMADWLFVPTTIVVTFRRDPVGEWIRLDAETTVGPDGRGLCRASLYDERGFVAAVEQALFVGRRA